METKRKRKFRGSKVYPLAVTGLAGLLLCAFFLPQILFRIKDNALYGEMELQKRDNVDVTLLSSSYETSLYQRMLRFAEGLDNDVSYYVSDQKMEVNEELYRQLRDNAELLEGPVTIMAWRVSNATFEGMTVKNWKKYVIYSDDYTKGVNFIIWYLDMRGENGESLELLVDAETFTIYAMSFRKIYSAGPQGEALDVRDRFYESGSLYERINADGWTSEDLYRWFQGYLEASYEDDSYGDGGASAAADFDEDSVTFWKMTEVWGGSEWINENELEIHLPYGDRVVDFQIQFLPQQEEQSLPAPKMVWGIAPICRLIPEFEQYF